MLHVTECSQWAYAPYGALPCETRRMKWRLALASESWQTSQVMLTVFIWHVCCINKQAVEPVNSYTMSEQGRSREHITHIGHCSSRSSFHPLYSLPLKTHNFVRFDCPVNIYSYNLMYGEKKDGSVCKVLALQACGSEFYIQHTHKNSRCDGVTWVSCFGDMQTGRSLGPIAWPA